MGKSYLIIACMKDDLISGMQSGFWIYWDMKRKLFPMRSRGEPDFYRAANRRCRKNIVRTFGKCYTVCM